MTWWPSFICDTGGDRGIRRIVMMDLANQKRKEVQQDYIKQMMDKYQVVLHGSAFEPK